MDHLAEQSCDVELPCDLDVVLEALTLLFNSFSSLSVVGRGAGKEGQSHTGLVLLELQIREVR